MDSLQQANAPLLPRPARLAETSKSNSNVLVCHDVKGGYHDYECARPRSGEFDLEQYSCRYLQHVDTFVHFSRKLVCIPLPAWTDTLRRNGTKVLGTVIVEPQTPHVGRMLRIGLLHQRSEAGVGSGSEGHLVRITDGQKWS